MKWRGARKSRRQFHYPMPPLWPPGTIIRTHTADTTGLAVVGITVGIRAYYHWYVDQLQVAITEQPSYVHQGVLGSQQSLSVIVTPDADFDGPANAPIAYPAIRTLEWTRSLGSAVKYRIQQATGQSSPSESDWSTIGYEPDDGRWVYQHKTGQLADVTWYWWRVNPVGAAGNVGTALVLNGGVAEFIVHRPDVPNVTAAISSSTQRLTVEAA